VVGVTSIIVELTVKIPKTMQFLIANYGDLNETENSQFDNHQVIELKK
jgi:hypothetical protein